jgi:hypothetical protein
MLTVLTQIPMSRFRLVAQGRPSRGSLLSKPTVDLLPSRRACEGILQAAPPSPPTNLRCPFDELPASHQYFAREHF